MSANDTVKLHRRVVHLDGANWTVLSLRPGDPAVLATNRDGETWHIVGGPDAAELLARLFWALGFQRHDRTVILIDRPFLVPNGSEEDPSSPILLVNSDLGTPGHTALDQLRTGLPLTTPSLGTVKLRTIGLDRASADPAGFEAAPEPLASDAGPHQWRERMDHLHGVLVYAAPGAVLRAQAVMIGALPGSLGPGTGQPAVVPIIEPSTRAKD